MKLTQIEKIYDPKSFTALIDTLLTRFDSPKVFSEDPSVDIENIAKNVGINGIVYAPSEEFYGTHAILEDAVLKINQSDSRAKQIFSIAHEIGHIVLGHIDITAEYKVARRGISGITELQKRLETENIVRTALLMEIIYEKTADFFAASLLVPLSRFLLWEDRPDADIAKAFGVEEKCIKERRKEVETIMPELALDTKAAG